MKQSNWLSRNRIFREILRLAGFAEPAPLAWQGAHGGRAYRQRDAYRPSVKSEDLALNEENLQLACSCYQAYVDRDRAALEALISEDFYYTSAYDNRINRSAYFQRCWPASRAISGYEFVHLAADGDCAFVTYEAEDTSGRRFRNTEVMLIRNGRIREIEVFTGWNVPHQAPAGGSLDKLR